NGIQWGYGGLRHQKLVSTARSQKNAHLFPTRLCYKRQGVAQAERVRRGIHTSLGGKAPEGLAQSKSFACPRPFATRASVLDCGSPLPLWISGPRLIDHSQSRDVLRVRMKSARRTGAVQKLRLPETFRHSRQRLGLRQSPAALDFNAKAYRPLTIQGRPPCSNEKRQRGWRGPKASPARDLSPRAPASWTAAVPLPL